MVEVAQNWTIEGFRITSFLRPEGHSPDIEKWFEILTGSRPNQFNRNGIQVSASGMLNGKLLEIGMNQARLDVGVRSPDLQRLSSNIGGLEDLGEISANLTDSIFDLPAWPDSMRLAIGVSIVLPVYSQEVAQTVWREIHGVEICGESDSTDFLYRINRPINSSTINSLNINRLIAWQSANIQLFHLQAQLGTQPGMTNLTPTDSSFVCKIDIDINTPGEYQLLANAQLQKAIAKELNCISVVLANKKNF